MLRERVREIFQRKPGRYEAVDGMRALAVLWVMIFHVGFVWGHLVPPESYTAYLFAPWNWIWSKGFFAMNLFFVISGFLIGDLLIAETERKGEIGFRAFYLRRFFRLAPAYYLVLAGLVAYGLFHPGLYRVESVWTNVLYVNNWFTQRHQPAEWAWSLAVEEQFYLVCPLLILALFRRKIRPALAIPALILGGVAYTYFVASTKGPFPLTYHPSQGIDDYYRYFDAFYANTFVRASALLLGVGCAYLRRSERWMARFGSPIGGMALAAFFFAMTFLCLDPARNPPPGAPTRPLQMSLLNSLSALSFAGVLILGLTGSRIGGFFRRVLSAPFFFPIAQLSYGLYLLHVPVITFVYRFFPPPPEMSLGSIIAYSLGAVAATLVFAFLLNVLFESPARKFGARLAKRAERAKRIGEAA